MVFRLAAGAVAEVVVPLGLAKAGFLSGSTGVLGVVAAAEERPEDAKLHYSTVLYSTVLQVLVQYCTVLLFFWIRYSSSCETD